MSLWHITTRPAWDEAARAGEYRPASLATEGFIHLSEDRQWLPVANRFYRGVAELVLLSIRPDRLRAEVRHEPADGELFPHLYGPLNLDAVVQVMALPRGEDGAIGIPEEIAPWRDLFVARLGT